MANGMPPAGLRHREGGMASGCGEAAEQNGLTHLGRRSESISHQLMTEGLGRIRTIYRKNV
jgi:hypothetical protein